MFSERLDARVAGLVHVVLDVSSVKFEAKLESLLLLRCRRARWYFSHVAHEDIDAVMLCA